MAAKKNDSSPTNESRDARLKRLRDIARTKDVRPVFWPGNKDVRKPGDELVGTLDDIRETQHKKYKSTELESVTVATVIRSDDHKAVLVQLSGSMKRQLSELHAELGDELLFLYRGKVNDYNEVGIELLTKATGSEP